MTTKKQLRLCKQGHKYYKSSNCPVCPICEQQNKQPHDFLSLLGAPARRALQNAAITNLQQLSTYSEAEILKLHGIGPASIPILKESLTANGLHFKNN